MKKLVLFITVLFIQVQLFAVKRTVSNNPVTPGQYTTVAAAVAASSANDTIYIVGSPIDYAPLIIDKRLTIIGSGYNPNKQNSIKTYISQIYAARTATSDPSNTKLIGINCGTIILSAAATASQLGGIIITRCDFNLVQYMAGFVSSILMYNNIIRGVSSYNTGSPYNNSPTLTFYNNIIVGTFFPTNGQPWFAGTLFFYNNLFLGYTGYGINLAYWSYFNATFNNNIFYGYSPYNATPNNINFNNNLSFSSGSNDNFNLTGSNSGANNLAATNPSFVSAPLTTAIYTNTADYHLLSGSPALTAGTGSTQIGIYGGSYPFPDGGLSGSSFQTSATAPIPLIYEMNMQNPLVPSTGTLNVQVKVKKVD